MGKRMPMLWLGNSENCSSTKQCFQAQDVCKALLKLTCKKNSLSFEDEIPGKFFKNESKIKVFCICIHNRVGEICGSADISEMHLISPLTTGETGADGKWNPVTVGGGKEHRFFTSAPAESVGDASETADSSPSRPLWFDYPDSDKKKILAIYQYIGEQPDFVAPSNFPRLLRYILIGSVILILLFFLYQIISKLLAKRSIS
ncbi:fertilization-influencing membrane protein isoform X1 [Sceloporus undulatus]|uniref:fertilization-influencing membrane protein isoform X1 n=1 Tax=Sceloporus undulatus TaxID=8520 RepID=UPI001C4BD510|nr:fertilization-influencing membrane protein isoform X1 [Sceloporus undulatus]